MPFDYPIAWGCRVIDPITAAAAATKAFSMVKAMVEHGKEAEDVLGQIGTWYGHASDCIYATKKNRTPAYSSKLYLPKA